MRDLSWISHLRPTSGEDRGVMRSFWKIFAALALMLPLGAFIAGNLVASAADDPSPRHTINIDDQSGTPTADPTPSSRPTRTPAGTPSAEASDEANDEATDDATEDQGDDHGG